MYRKWRGQLENGKASANPDIFHDKFLVVFFLYCIFDWTIWAYVPLDPNLISLFRQIIDGIFYSTVIMKYLLGHGSPDLNARKMLVAMGVIIFSVTISTIIYHSKVFLSIQTVFVVFRYSVVLLMPRAVMSNQFKKIIAYTFFIQLLFGFIEGAGLFDLRPFLLPAPDRWMGLETFNPTSFREGSVGISSSFLNSIDYSLYLMASYVMLYWQKKKVCKSIVAILVLFIIFQTQSKTSLVIFSGLLIYEMHSRLLKWIIIGVLFTPAIILVVANFELIVFFLENSLEYSRIGFFVYLLPRFFIDNPIHILFGVGIDPYEGLNAIRHYPVIPRMLLDENSLLNLKDVFWLAQLFQWGILGLTALLTFLVSIYRTHKSEAIRGMILITFLLGLTNQVMEVKIFSFLLWLTIKYYKSLDEFAIITSNKRSSILRFMQFP